MTKDDQHRLIFEAWKGWTDPAKLICENPLNIIGGQSVADVATDLHNRSKEKEKKKKSPRPGWNVQDPNIDPGGATGFMDDEVGTKKDAAAGWAQLLAPVAAGGVASSAFDYAADLFKYAWAPYVAGVLTGGSGAPGATAAAGGLRGTLAAAWARISGAVGGAFTTAKAWASGMGSWLARGVSVAGTWLAGGATAAAAALGLPVWAVAAIVAATGVGVAWLYKIWNSKTDEEAAKHLSNPPQAVKDAAKKEARRRDRSDQTGNNFASKDNADSLMRMLHAETSWRRSDLEHAAIIQVAINRMSKRGTSNASDVVAPRTSGWNDAGRTYPINYANAHKYYHLPRAKRARTIVDRALNGSSLVGNLDGAIHFLHPGSSLMRRCDQDGLKSGKFICHDAAPGTSLGLKRLPKWAVHVSKGGTSKTVPKFYGTALVSGGGVLRNHSTRRVQVIKTNRNKSSKPNIVGIGDSITVGYGGLSWVDYLGGRKFAHGGWSSTKIRTQIFDKHILPRRGPPRILPDYLVILAGINNHNSPTRVIDDLNYMAIKAQERGIKVKILTLLPSAGYWDRKNRKGGDEVHLGKIKVINDWILSQTWKRIQGSGAVDTSSLGDETGKLMASTDGLHPNRKGQSALAQLIHQQMKIKS